VCPSGFATARTGTLTLAGFRKIAVIWTRPPTRLSAPRRGVEAETNREWDTGSHKARGPPPPTIRGQFLYLVGRPRSPSGAGSATGMQGRTAGTRARPCASRGGPGLPADHDGNWGGTASRFDLAHGACLVASDTVDAAVAFTNRARGHHHRNAVRPPWPSRFARPSGSGPRKRSPSATGRIRHDGGRALRPLGGRVRSWGVEAYQPYGMTELNAPAHMLPISTRATSRGPCGVWGHPKPRGARGGSRHR